MKKVVFYCQHILGMGHLMRSLALVRGLRAFEVLFINGGEMIPGVAFPPGVSVVNLPPLRTDADFQSIETVDGQNLAEIEANRTRRLLAAYESFKPDAVVIELFPFGRKKFGFELLPLLARIGAEDRKPKVICSLRDILVSRTDQAKYEERVVRLMRQHFDALLVHADPEFQRLDETFQRVADLGVPLVYTGYVTQPDGPNPPDSELELEPAPDRPLIVVSIGGGRVGHELVSASMAASRLLQPELPHQLLIFTGPFLPAEQFDQLEAAAAGQPHISLRRYTNRFAAHLKRASLSVSLAGYNTCMDILQAKVPALVLPFAGGGNDEQLIRARKLEALDVVECLGPEMLDPQSLAAKMRRRLQTQAAAARLDMNGVVKTAGFLTELLSESTNSRGVQLNAPTLAINASGIRSKLRARLDQLQGEGRSVRIFLRDDDVDVDEASLRRLLEVSAERGVPVNLEIIPGRLTAEAISLLKTHKRAHPALVGLNQHGWLHLNHEVQGKKCEFGPGRSFEQQLADITQGRRLLETTFGEWFFPAFTPPWNRCTDVTRAALSQSGFAALSQDCQPPLNGHEYRDIPVTLDIFRWRGQTCLKPPDEIVDELLSQLGTQDPIGLMLHHKVMDERAFSLLDQLLAELTTYPNIHFHTFESLLQPEHGS
jgi:predicted glycosyltransferase